MRTSAIIAFLAIALISSVQLKVINLNRCTAVSCACVASNVAPLIKVKCPDQKIVDCYQKFGICTSTLR